MPFVVRPAHIRGTPRAIAEALGWSTKRYPSTHPLAYDYATDFVMAPTAPLSNQPEGYEHVRTFAGRNKLGQRRLLADGGIPIPRTFGSWAEAQGTVFEPGQRFVLRPFRHFGGLGYVVTDFNGASAENQYISELWPKQREYRVIFVFGKPVIYLRKKQHDGVTSEEPWNAGNSSFQTINDWASCRLSDTDCVSRLMGYPVIARSHIVAADILYNAHRDPRYCVVELNFCPGLDIDTNRERVVDLIRHRHDPVPVQPTLPLTKKVWVFVRFQGVLQEPAVFFPTLDAVANWLGRPCVANEAVIEIEVPNNFQCPGFP